MTNNTIAKIWFELSRVVLGVAWSFPKQTLYLFGVPQPAQTCVDLIQYTWWQERGPFFLALAGEMAEQLAAAPEPEALPMHLSDHELMPLLQGAFKEVVIRHFGEQPWLSEAVPYPLVLTTAAVDAAQAELLAPGPGCTHMPVGISGSAAAQRAGLVIVSPSSLNPPPPPQMREQPPTRPIRESPN